MNCIVRDGKSDDYESITKIAYELHNLHVKGRPDVYLENSNPLSKQDFEEILNSSTQKLFVVEDYDTKKLIGYAVVQNVITKKISIMIKKKYVFIDDFCIMAIYRKRHIGKLLFESIVNYANRENASELQLVVWEFNKEAIGFYEKMGMKIRNRRMELKLT